MEDGSKTAKAVGGKKRVAILVCGVAVAAVVAVVFWPGPKEPEYQGKKLSEWVAMRTSHPGECEQAVKAIGTNAVPQLLTLVRYERPKWSTVMASSYLALPKLVVRTDMAERIRYGSRERVA